MMVQAFELIRQQAEKDAKDPKVQAIATGAAPKAVEYVVTAVSANPAAGSAAGLAAKAVARSDPEGFTRGAAGVGYLVGGQVLGAAMIPIAIGSLIYDGAKRLIGR